MTEVEEPGSEALKDFIDAVIVPILLRRLEDRVCQVERAVGETAAPLREHQELKRAA